MLPEVFERDEDDPIWPRQWKENEQIFGAYWSQCFSKNYGFTSHELRSFVVTQLQVMNVSPYMLYEVTRHSVGGMSEVVSGYVRPSIQELREVIERLN